VAKERDEIAILNQAADAVREKFPEQWNYATAMASGAYPDTDGQFTQPNALEDAMAAMTQYYISQGYEPQWAAYYAHYYATAGAAALQANPHPPPNPQDATAPPPPSDNKNKDTEDPDTAEPPSKRQKTTEAEETPNEEHHSPTNPTTN